MDNQAIFADVIEEFAERCQRNRAPELWTRGHIHEFADEFRGNTQGECPIPESFQQLAGS